MNAKGFIPGGTWLAGATDHVPPVWGAGDDVLWAMGEPLILVGPPGVGKSTLAQQLALARCGAVTSDHVLGYMVTPDPDRLVAYIAADRPQQVQRSMRRMMIGTHWKDRLDDHLRVWEGPLPFDVISKPDALAAWLIEHEVGTVVIDSIKDMAGDVSDGRSVRR